MEVEGIVARAGRAAVALLAVVEILPLHTEVEQERLGSGRAAAGLSRLTTPVERIATPTPPIERICSVPGVFCSPMPYIV